MTRCLLSIFLAFQLAAAPAFATNITVQSGRDTEDRISVLRGIAEVLLRETQERVTIQEGEELVVKRGGRTEITEPPAPRPELSRLVESVKLEEMPDTLRSLQESQAQNFKALQDTFKSLTSLEAVKPEDQQAFFKTIERQVGVIMEDQLILQGMRQKVDAALADPNLSASQRTQLAGYAKMVADSAQRINAYAAESKRMARTQFKLASISEGQQEAAQQVAEEMQAAQSEVQAIMSELQGRPSGLSQDFFNEARDTVIESLSRLDEMVKKVSDLLAENPQNQTALALLKQLTGYQTQSAILLRDLAVTEVDPSVLVEAQQVKDELENKKANLKARLQAIKARDQEDVSKAEIEELFKAYDEASALEAKGRALGETIARGLAGQKFITAEQQELKDLVAGISDAFLEIGGAAAGLEAGARDSVWAAYLKEEEEAELVAQGSGPQLELSDDVTADTIYTPPAPVMYYPIPPNTVRDDVAAELSGAAIGDVIVKDNIAYGVAMLNIRSSLIGSAQAADYGDLREGDLVAFRVENGQYTSANLGTFDVYAGALHAALDINSDGELAVFLAQTEVGEKQMTGEFFTLDKGTLAQLDPAATMDLGDNRGWFPRFDESGNLLSLYIDGNQGQFSCVGPVCTVGPLTAGAFAAATEALRAQHSGGTYSRDDYSGELPAAVLANRLSGATEAERLGGYSHLSWGRWNDGAGVVDTIHTNSPWIAGSLTPDADVPVTGQATYAGQVFGKLTENGTLSAITGTTDLIANFSSRSLAGTFTMKKDGAGWKDADVSASWAPGGNKLTGIIATNDMAGAVNGNFFGPQAAQVGGSWNLSNGTDASAAGVFTGEKQ